MSDTTIRKTLAESTSGSESSSVVLEVDTRTGESQLVVSKTYSEYYPVTKHDDVMELHERLIAGGGRRSYRLEELTR